MIGLNAFSPLDLSALAHDKRGRYFKRTLAFLIAHLAEKMSFKKTLNKEN